jgi:long-chain-fatty-acid--CoA ligase ACSBG
MEISSEVKVPYDLGKYSLQISAEGMAQLLKKRSDEDPLKNVIWATDPRVELPVLVGKEGKAALPPITVSELWNQLLPELGPKPAINDKINGKWVTQTYQQYYDNCIRFAQGMVRLGISQRSAVSILGYNQSNWLISFFGAIFANCVACGHYLTNGPDAVLYVMDHSDTELMVVENQEQLDKVLQVWDQCPTLKYVVVWREFTIDPKYEKFADRVMSHDMFMAFEPTSTTTAELQHRMIVQKPGNAISYVYTSGTTGNPKGVMLSHDNYVWTAKALEDPLINQVIAEGRPVTCLSFLPLSHVAAQYNDLFLTLVNGANVYFTDVNALKGTLINYLLEIRPVMFVAVPRVYEKMEDKVRAVLDSKPTIARWASYYGRQGTDAQMKGQSPSIAFKVMEKLVLNRVKKNLGLDNAAMLISGAAPISNKTRQFFFDHNMFINNTFGMSETTAPMTTMLSPNYSVYDLKSAGQAVPGTEISLAKSDPNSETGELCFRGRNIFMGYLKNDQATKETIDNQKRVHSGDEGKISKEGLIYITGRIKELLVTAGGENIAPVIIENNLREQLPFMSNIMVIGDHQKFVAALMTFKVTSNASELPNHQLAPDAIEDLKKVGITGITTVQDAMNNKEIAKIIQNGIDLANKKAVSNAAKVKAWFIVADDFSIPGGEFTPTLKVKRKIVTNKYAKEITDVYSKPDL